MLEPVEGPECPYCGCKDVRVVDQRSRWGKPIVRSRCRHCGAMFTAAAPVPDARDPPEDLLPAERPAGVAEAVIYRPIRCPDCGSAETKITSTQRPIRYHKCRCGRTFKSVEG